MRLVKKGWALSLSLTVFCCPGFPKGLAQSPQGRPIAGAEVISAAEQQSAVSLGTIRGTVIDPSGKRIEGASVYADGENYNAEGYPPTSRSGTVTTNSNGEFVLDVKPGKDIRVHVSKQSDLYNDVVTVFDVPPNWTVPHIDVLPGQTVAGVIFQLPQKAGKLQLRVLDADTKALVHGIYFQLCREDHPDASGYCLTGSGPPDFEHFIPAGVGISVKVSSDEHGNSDYQWQYSDLNGSPYVTVKPGETETITAYVTQPDPYSIGLVQGAVGSYARGMYVSFIDKNIQRLGDRVSVALLKIFTDSELSNPQTARSVLPVIRQSFSEPKFITTEIDKKPRITLFLLNYLQERISDGQTKRDIEATIKFVEEKTAPNQ